MLMYRFGNWKPSRTPVDEMFKASLIILEIGIMEPRAQVLGSVGIFDLQGLGLNHAFQMTPSVAQMLARLMVSYENFVQARESFFLKALLELFENFVGIFLKAFRSFFENFVRAF
jgi:hypothetical protein